MYIKKNHLNNFIHIQIPRKIWKMFLEKELSITGFKIYVELFDRMKLSAFNNWIDNNDNVYIKYSYDELMVILNVRSKGTIADGLAELKKLELIIQEKGFNTSSKFYLTNILNDLQSSKKSDHSRLKNQTTEVQFPRLQKSEKLDTNNNNINHNKFNNNNNNNNTVDNVVVDEISLFLEKNNLNTKAIAEAIKKYTYNLEYIKTQLDIANKLKALGKINNAQGCFSNALTKNIALTLPNVEKKENYIKPSTKELGIKEKKIIKNNMEAKIKYDEEAKLRENYDRYFDTLTEEEREYIEQKSYNLAVEKYGDYGLKTLIDTMTRTETRYIVLEKYIKDSQGINFLFKD